MTPPSRSQRAQLWRPIPRPAESFCPIDLLMDGEALTGHLCEQAARRNWFDAFLLGAGLLQVVEDGPAWLRAGMQTHAALSNLPGHRTPAVAASSVNAVAGWASRGLPGRRPLRQRAVVDLVSMVKALCSLALDEHPHDEGVQLAAEALVGSAARLAGMLPDVRRQIVRIPSCFRSFDQQVEDIDAIVGELLGEHPAADAPVTVVGVRTSGCYLAPLAAALLQRRGIRNVRWATVRPNWPLSRWAEQVIGEAAHRATCLVLDDPPTTGASLAAALDAIAARGVSRRRLYAGVASFPSSAPAIPMLRAKANVIDLPWSSWSINARLRPEWLTKTLDDLLVADHSVEGVRLRSPVQPPNRSHVRAEWDVAIRMPDGGTVVETIVTEGTGAGYFGRHVSAVACSAPGLFPLAVGEREGLLVRYPVPGEIDPAGPGAYPAPERVAGHLYARSTALAVPSDVSVRCAGRQPVWEVAARIAGRSCGRLDLAVRLPLVTPLVKGALMARRPSIVDGCLGPEHWSDDGPVARKVAFAEGAFSHHDLACYDAVYDLAGVAVQAGDSGYVQALRRSYEEHTGQPIDPERWLLYRWVHAWNLARLGTWTPIESARACACCAQEYAAERLLADIPVVTNGPWCALDLDGVLETSPLGFPTTTWAGAMALRALRAHGYPLVLVTGRSLLEVVARCRTYGAQGAVAEYGGRIYDARTGEVEDLVTPSAAHARLRDAALAEGFKVDPAYVGTVRVFRPARHGGTVGLERRETQELLQGVPGAFEAVPGEAQTDFVAVGTTKAEGLARLLGRLTRDGAGSHPGRPAIAMGDSPTDEGFVRMAERGYLPGNASFRPRQPGLHRVRHRYQAGLAEAVGQLLGHRPGGCARCAPPDLPQGAKALLGLLSVQEDGWHGAARRMAASFVAARWAARSCGAEQDA
jgi:hydroxymethylpyrimidine pyrophosphatase-like HAD family hydrolase